MGNEYGATCGAQHGKVCAIVEDLQRSDERQWIEIDKLKEVTHEVAKKNSAQFAGIMVGIVLLLVALVGNLIVSIFRTVSLTP